MHWVSQHASLIIAVILHVGQDGSLVKEVHCGLADDLDQNCTYDRAMLTQVSATPSGMPGGAAPATNKHMNSFTDGRASHFV